MRQNGFKNLIDFNSNSYMSSLVSPNFIVMETDFYIQNLRVKQVLFLARSNQKGVWSLRRFSPQAGGKQH